MWIDFSVILTFLIWYGITAVLLMIAYIFKKSFFALVPVTYFLVILGITGFNSTGIQDMVVHRIFNFTGLGVSIVLYIVINDIETRRKIIGQMFKNRYNNAKNNRGDSDESDSTES